MTHSHNFILLWFSGIYKIMTPTQSAPLLYLREVQNYGPYL